MHLTLLVPGLLWPREILHDTTFDLELPALSLLLGRGRRQPLAGEEAWLAKTFDVPAPLPVAPLRLLGDGGNPSHDEWLCLDPVHLRLEERAIVVDDPARLALTADEDAALRAAVAPLFVPLGDLVAPSAPCPGHWYLRLKQRPALETQALPHVVGRSADPMTPAGDDGAAWRRLLAEVQPLLHHDPVNRAREAAGRPTINSLWPWGLGRLPPMTRHAFDRIWNGDALLKGLGALAGVLVEPVPDQFTRIDGRVLVRLDHLMPSLGTFDATAWRHGLSEIDANWLAPALVAVRTGRCRGLTMIASGHGRAFAVDIGRRDHWRFWRKPRPLSDIDT